MSELWPIKNCVHHHGRRFEFYIFTLQSILLIHFKIQSKRFINGFINYSQSKFLLPNWPPCQIGCEFLFFEFFYNIFTTYKLNFSHIDLKFAQL